MTDDIIKERYFLAKARISELCKEMDLSEKECEYVKQCVGITEKACCVYEYKEKDELKFCSLEKLREWNDYFFEPLRGTNYESSFANPAYARECFGEEGKYLCYFFKYIREMISYAYQGRLFPLVRRMELLLQLYAQMVEERHFKTMLYYEAHDYSMAEIEESLDELVNPALDFAVRIIMESDFSDMRYLYLFGENITENEIKMAEHLCQMPEQRLVAMARTYTEGYRKGFEAAGIDLSEKDKVDIRYPLGFEPMVKQAILQFEEMGLEPIVYVRSDMAKSGIITTPANRQFLYDHRYDNALYLNKAITKQKLQELEHAYKERKDLAAGYAGPAVIEVFGETLFVPKKKKESPSYTKEQEELSIAYQRDSFLIRNQYIPEEKRSFTIISYPIPEIGERFPEIFDRTVEINTLDTEVYANIQQKLIDALDEGEFVTVTGRGENHTNMKIMLHPLSDPKKETNFENCLADVNIPVGEVFTSPILTGTEGTLHVTQVYLEGLKFKNLELKFHNGMITEYTCSNYSSEEENKKYIKENILYNRETLPIGEFAIGTNTAAYQMGNDFQINDRLPILIAEKTGPHFAVGDTCYSMSEDTVVKNPDGKEVIARENECSILRKTKMEMAYFNCHTDITIPYGELGDIIVCGKEGKQIPLIQEGRFVLPGTEDLNNALDANK